MCLCTITSGLHKVRDGQAHFGPCNLFLLLNILTHSSPARSRKKMKYPQLLWGETEVRAHNLSVS
jgi:hypothetical protein